MHECTALSDFSGESTLFDPQTENQTNASLSQKMANFISDNNCKINEYKVKTISLDEYLINKNLEFADLVKIDVELHEPAVFKGMKKTMESQKPYILFEVLTSDIANELNTIFESFPYYGLYTFIKRKETFKLKKVNTIIGNPSGNWNYLACPDDRKPKLFGIISE